MSLVKPPMRKISCPGQVQPQAAPSQRPEQYCREHDLRLAGHGPVVRNAASVMCQTGSVRAIPSLLDGHVRLELSPGLSASPGTGRG